MSNNTHDDRYDRLIDTLLDEELGERRPPDLSKQILDKADAIKPVRQTVSIRYRLLAVAATVLFLSIFAVATLIGDGSYPEIEMVGISVNEASGVYEADGSDARLVLGGYCEIMPSKGTTFKIEGTQYDEKIYLLSGDVRCSVNTQTHNKKKAGFEVRTDVGAVRVTGTEFTVALTNEEGTREMKRMIVNVLAGSVIVAGSWGETAMAADGTNSMTFRAQGAQEEVKLGEKAIVPKELTVRESDRATIRKGLKETVLGGMSFSGVEMSTALYFLRTKILGAAPDGKLGNLLLKAPKAKEPKVTLEVPDGDTLESTLKSLCKLSGLDYSVEPYGIIFHQPGDAPDARVSPVVSNAAERKAIERLEGTKIPEMRVASIKVDTFLNSLTNQILTHNEDGRSVSFEIAKGVDVSDLTVTMTMKNVSAREVLEALCHLDGLTYALKGETVVVSKKK